MPLAAGERLGPYEILAAIGAGGMGEVYRARDTRLNREVAIKVSAERFSERFDREARAVASLNHPNICTLYDVGPNYLVMELIEGPTLAERIKEGPVPLEEALPIARQMAEALDAAHDKGIVHRDLKPGNVKIKPDGTVKVLDFGLAKSILSREGAGADPDNSPTLTMAQATEAGIILGTASYMAPEQAKGKPVDRRADIYAFGAVLYEMLTGKRLHNGETTTEVLASVMKEEPRWEIVPPQVRRLLQRCLEKDPQKRLRHIGDVMALVEEGPGASASSGRGSESGPQFSWAPWAIAGALTLALAVVSWNWWRATRPTDLPLVRQDIDLDPDIVLPAPVPYVTNVVISPDGARLAYVANAPQGPAKLYTRRLDQPKQTELAGTEGARGPFFSPDGKWLGYFANGKLFKIPVDGGAAVPLAELSAFGGASWSEDGIYVSEVRKPLERIPVGGGAPTAVTELAPGELVQVSPQILPGGRALLFSGNKGAGPDTATVEVVSLSDRSRKTLVPGGAFPRYAPSVTKGSGGSGHLLYTFKGALYALPFDLSSLETRGAAVAMLNDVSLGPLAVAGKFDVSGTGILVYQKSRAGGGTGGTTIQWLDPAGKPQPLLAKPAIYWDPRFSPDGKRIALRFNEGSNEQIEVYDWQTDRTTQLTFGPGVRRSPVWSPDGQYLAFFTFNPLGGMFWTRADGSGQPQPLFGSGAQAPGSFSPDGKFLAYVEGGLVQGGQIWILPVDSQNGQLKAGKPTQFLNDQFSDTSPAISPDGKWLAYSSAESSTRTEVFVRPFPAPPSGQGGKWLVSTQGGDSPVWSRAGHELFYQAPGGPIMAASYSVKGDAFVVDKPRVWLANYGGVAFPAGTGFDLAPDGKRIAAVLAVQSATPPKPDHEVAFVENFFDELRRQAPASGK